MEGHPQYNELRTMCARYPKHAQGLFQTYSDIMFVQQWVDVDVLEIAALSRPVLTGRKTADEPRRIVVPCSLSENLSIKWYSTLVP
ncbi:hypothetical protein BS47DRAFT_1086746 [Hydnum rufescens UP504]|uniref:tRNA-splicing endonuclease subunit Sen15 domain-containing protein n=1 Tax=Hydnum rufescens UP504 TaxID=1448309 RepID=A0A9P6B903_9AGAM|nr:hypothetical protein BS47DRAFT_1086746 [Hydnum rufescens UP504]